uniref:Uncharacterized protein n=1 Tax=Psilocybe cubensis TaxID=181762 RepID=A0A8H7XVV4_PSICU
MSLKSTGHIVISAISVLYFLCFLDCLLQWYFLNFLIVSNGDTRESIFNWIIVGGKRWMWVLNNFLFYCLFVVSDVLLIWRCYHVWGKSWRIIVVPSFLLVVECGLSFAITLLDGINSSMSSDAKFRLCHSITSALLFASLATTVSTTFAIGYRIHHYVKEMGHRFTSERKLNNIIVMLLESAALYSILLIVYAVMAVVPSFNTAGSPVLQASYYVRAILTGMAPTILVARLALTASSRPATVAAAISHISGLQFDGPTRWCSWGTRSDNLCNARPIISPVSIENEEQLNSTGEFWRAKSIDDVPSKISHV